jgi:lincosamide nucleotidyltransferase A/C/D/E
LASIQDLSIALRTNGYAHNEREAGEAASRMQSEVLRHGDEMVNAEDAVGIYQKLSANRIHLWLTGGWGINALIGQQSRPHKDLDVITLVDDAVAMREVLSRDGYRLKELWSENRSAIEGNGVETATAFVLQDSDDHEIDVHAMRVDDRGRGLPAWEAEGLFFQRHDLAGEGIIEGFAVRCLGPEMQMLCHACYELPEWQRRDLKLLHERFGIRYPDQHSSDLTSV